MLASLLKRFFGCRLIDHVLSLDELSPWIGSSSSSSSNCDLDVQLRCASELQLSRTLWNHLLTLNSSSHAATPSSLPLQSLSQMDLLSLWLASPLLRTYDYSDNEIIQMITQAPSKDGKYNLKSFRAGFYRVFAVVDSNCSAGDMSVCSHLDADEQQQQQQQQQLDHEHHPLVIDIGSSVGYFPFLSLSLGAHVYASSLPSQFCCV
jgi:hypothetical protein